MHMILLELRRIRGSLYGSAQMFLCFGFATGYLVEGTFCQKGPTGRTCRFGVEKSL